MSVKPKSRKSSRWLTMIPTALARLFWRSHRTASVKVGDASQRSRAVNPETLVGLVPSLTSREIAALFEVAGCATVTRTQSGEK